MAFTYHTFTNQGGTAGCAEIASWMTSNFPGMFDTYEASEATVLCKIDGTTMLTLKNADDSQAGFVAVGEERKFSSSTLMVYESVVADIDNNVVVFMSSGGGYPIITLCKNEDGDTCGVVLITQNASSIMMPTSGSIDVPQNSRVHVYNFTRNTDQMIPCGFARITQNAISGYPLVDTGGKKIQNVWIGGSSSLKELVNPIEVLIDSTIYCSIRNGWILIK